MRSVIAVSVSGLLSASFANAAITTSGAVSPVEPFWQNGGGTSIGRIGGTGLPSDGDGFLSVTGGSVLTISGLIFGNHAYFGQGVVEGANSSIISSGLTMTNGDLMISDGGQFQTGATIIDGGSRVNVIGEGSFLSNHTTMWITEGSLAVSNGAAFTSSAQVQIARYAGTTGELYLQGASVNLSRTNIGMIVGGAGTGRLSVTNDSNLTMAGSLYLGSQLAAGSTGRMLVSGDSTVNVGDAIILNQNSRLTVSSGGRVTADTIGFSGTSEMDVFINPSGAASIEANAFSSTGIVNLYAVGLAVGVYTPIVSNPTSSMVDAVNGFGGTWNAANRTFVVGAIRQGALVNESAAGVRLGFDSNALVVAFSDQAGVGSFDAFAIAPLTIDGQVVIAGYEFASNLLDSDAMLTMDIGGGYQIYDLTIWSKAHEGAEWMVYFPGVVDYSGGELSFTASTFHSYAVTAIPEPGTLGLLGVVAIVVFVMLRRRRLSAQR